MYVTDNVCWTSGTRMLPGFQSASPDVKFATVHGMQVASGYRQQHQGQNAKNKGTWSESCEFHDDGTVASQDLKDWYFPVIRECCKRTVAAFPCSPGAGCFVPGASDLR